MPGLIQNNSEMAIRRLNQQIENDPKNPKVHELLGSVYMVRNDNAKAEEEYKKAASLDPENDSQQLVLANFYEVTGQGGKALDVIQALIREDPDNPLLKKRLAVTYLNQRDFDQGLRVTAEILKADSNDTDARITKARILMAQNKL